MFDLVDILKTDDDSSKAVSASATNCALFYQTSSCHQLVHEAFRFEGMAQPSSLALSDKVLDKIGPEIELVFIELTQSDDVVVDAERILPQLPTHVSVVIIGQEDAISTIRRLKQMGMYYLFWPVSKEELIDFTYTVFDNRHSTRGVGNKRRAKQVAVIATKGGLGSTLISSEIAHVLASERKVPTMLIDHHYSAGNMDIMLGLKQYQKRAVQPGTLMANIDNSYASGLVKKLDERLSLLAVDSQELTSVQLREYTNAIKQQVAFDINMMVEDYGNSINSAPDIEALLSEVDTLVMVFDPTVSSLRDLNRLTALVAKHNQKEQVRVINVMNCSRPKNTESITAKDIERYFSYGVDITIGFDANANEKILSGQRIAQTNSVMAKPMQALAALILGEQVERGTPSLFHRIKHWVAS